jgi:hypothetical protein
MDHAAKRFLRAPFGLFPGDFLFHSHNLAENRKGVSFKTPPAFSATLGRHNNNQKRKRWLRHFNLQDRRMSRGRLFRR